MKEVERKVLEVSVEEIKTKLLALNAKETQNTKMVIDWFGPKGLTHNGDDPWYLRIRKFGDDYSEISWKSLPVFVGNTRQSEEVTVEVKNSNVAKDLLKGLNFENYAHQEKIRNSFVLEDWIFDLDQYPGMPPYLEIEGKDHIHVDKAVKMLGLENHIQISEGEKKLIEEKYGLNWRNMSF